MPRRVEIGSKIRPKTSSSYMVVHTIYHYGGVTYVGYVWYNKDGTINSHPGHSVGKIDTLASYTEKVNSGFHDFI